jgi:hypothetical protein
MFIRGVRHGVSKGIEDGRRPPTLRVATPETALWLFQGRFRALKSRAWWVLAIL